MADSKSLVPVDEDTSFTGRAGTAWRIIKGDRSSDPLYIKLNDAQKDLMAIDSMVRKALGESSGNTAAITRNLVSRFQESQAKLMKNDEFIQQIQASVDEYEKSLKVQERELNETNKNVSQLTKEREALKQQIATLNQRVETLRESLSTLTSGINKLISSIEDQHDVIDAV